MESGGPIRWLRIRLGLTLTCSVRSAWIVDLERRTSPSTCGQCRPWLELECSLGGFRADSKTVLGKAQSPRVKASQGFYCSGFINQTNKQNQTNPHVKVTNKQTSVQDPHFNKHFLLIGFYPIKQNKTKQNKLHSSSFSKLGRK